MVVLQKVCATSETTFASSVELPGCCSVDVPGGCSLDQPAVAASLATCRLSSADFLDSFTLCARACSQAGHHSNEYVAATSLVNMSFDPSSGYVAPSNLQDFHQPALPIFNIERVEFKFSISSEFVAAQVANNVLILALSNGRILRIDLDSPADIDGKLQTTTLHPKKLTRS